MQKYCKTTTFASYKIPESRLLQRVGLHHGFDDFLIFVLDDKPFECLLSELDLLQIIHLHKLYIRSVSLAC